jgi:NADPH2:quinone reductase
VGLRVPQHGGSNVLEVTEIEVAQPGPGQLLVEVEAAGVNFVDVYLREGIYQSPLPHIVGREGAGTVIEIGSGVTGFATGERVAWATAPGSAAGLVLVDADSAAAVPDAVASDVAAAAMLQGMTAHYLVNATYAVQPGDWALVHAAAGGVGQLLVQMIRERGGHVIATVSTAAKAAKVSELGADYVLNYVEEPAVAAKVRDLAGGGVAVVYDGVGKATFDSSLASLKPRGMLALFGGSSGQVPPFDLQRLNHGGSLFLTRPVLDHYLLTPQEFRQRSGAVLGALANATLKIEIGGRYPLVEAARAYDDLENRRTTGKLLLIP